MQNSYIISAHEPQQLPRAGKPEVAFVGRSNAGKSSLLNSLFKQRLARTSRQPGRTQAINFFGIGDKFVVADLPGYGFATTSKWQQKKWQPLVDAYVERAPVKLFLFLIDCRRDPDDLDMELIALLQSKAATKIVLTKTDKLNRQELIQTVRKYTEIFCQEPYPVSSLKGAGLVQLNAVIKDNLLN